MATTVRTKALKKQISFSEIVSDPPPAASPVADAVSSQKLEQALAGLEDAVFYVLDSDKDYAFHDVEFLFWNRKLKNIATQLSLALSERGGPRQFHQHYRHDPDDFDTLRRVAGPSALEVLARVAREALCECSDMVGMQDEEVRRHRDRLEHSLRTFLTRYQAVIQG